MIEKKHIAIICDYKLMEDRIGGMDYFFWAFDASCKTEDIKVDWFFPNLAQHGLYGKLHIIPLEQGTLEQAFLSHIKSNNVQYTHIYTHFLELCTPFFAKVKKHQDAKIVAVDHNPRPLGGYPIKKQIKKRLKGLFFSKYIDVFVAVSNHAKQALMYDFGNQIENRVVVILNGLNVKKYIQKTAFYTHHKFIVASHLRKEKGIQDLILAASRLQAYQFNIDIYGEGYYESELKALARTHALEKRICFKGSVVNLHELYSHYDYLIHPTHGETFGYAVVEGLLSNLPVITTKHGNVLGLIEDGENGFLFEANKAGALSVLLEQVLKKEKIITKVSKTDIKSQFLIETMVSKYMGLLNN
ncbi:glycosyltransferase family 4 protein [Flavobacteriaceae bacterium XHP0103]|uniref:glycosyltransferase family 4 protein n=1 Tax=Marixanthotalea marina TaxID=2844359 RepID=UPI002989D9A7|nr:glycosyltransferase family 4 protein [Marixanthotalea marina]MBU3822730.1 glycosyltransferase family 4 protein [Marixanthotalea marina]